MLLSCYTDSLNFILVYLFTVTNDNEWYEASNPYMVTHFDDEWAKLCYDPGAEEFMRGVKITSKEVRK